MAREIFERELREADEDIELIQGLYDSWWIFTENRKYYFIY
jgi:hypothetical protein